MKRYPLWGLLRQSEDKHFWDPRIVTCKKYKDDKHKQRNQLTAKSRVGRRSRSPGERSTSNISPPFLPLYPGKMYTVLRVCTFSPSLVSEAQLKGKGMINEVWVKCKTSHFFTQVKPHAPDFFHLIWGQSVEWWGAIFRPRARPSGFQMWSGEVHQPSPAEMCDVLGVERQHKENINFYFL